MPFKVSKPVVCTSEKNTHGLVTDWGIVSLKALVWGKEQVMESVVSNRLNEAVVWYCGERAELVGMGTASQHGFLENLPLQINIILFHVWLYLSGVYKYVQEAKISYTRGLFIL